jgi:hypothetical protein
MAKKAAVKPPAKKAPAKRKPAKRKPVTPVAETTREFPWRLVVRYAAFGVAMMLFGAMGGIWSAGGIEIGPGRSDVLSQSYDRDRVTQIAVLREMAAQPFDGATDDGRREAGEWFNANRFRSRAVDFGGYTDAVAEAIAANAEADLAKKLEAK